MGASRSSWSSTSGEAAHRLLYAKGRPPGTGKLAPVQAFLFGEVEKKPDITMPELAARLMTEHGITAAPAALSRLLCRNGFTYKKSPDGGGMRTHRHSG